MEFSGHGDLQVSEDLSFQRREFAAERIAWAVMAAVVVASLLGLLGGSGPFAGGAAGDAAAGALAVYERLAHIQRPTSLRLEALAGPDEREIELEINAAYLERVTVEGVTPEPTRVEASPGGVRYTFAVEPGSTLAAVFSVQPVRPGPARVEVRRGGDTVSFTQYVYP